MKFLCIYCDELLSCVQIIYLYYVLLKSLSCSFRSNHSYLLSWPFFSSFLTFPSSPSLSRLRNVLCIFGIQNICVLTSYPRAERTFSCPTYSALYQTVREGIGIWLWKAWHKVFWRCTWKWIRLYTIDVQGKSVRTNVLVCLCASRQPCDL